MQRWSPPVGLSRQEEALLKRGTRVRALFGFLRQHRHELFDEAFQEQLESMYRDTGAGEEPRPPALLCMVVLLQGYVGASDAEAVELSVVDLRWQMVLGCLGAASPPFSQGGLQAFRDRMIAHEMDRVLLERTVALVRSGTITQAEGRSVSKALRAAIDSRPLSGAGRVEDTINLLGHAARSIVRLASKLMDRDPDEICRKAGIPLLLAPSIKAGLDIDWSDPKQKAMAVEVVERQVSSLQRWLDRHLDDVVSAPLQPYIDAIMEVSAQDLEVCEDGTPCIRQGVAPDRRISVEDAEMRHGRKSRSKRFDGYKEHIARDLDFPAIVACAVTPANRPEELGAVPIAEDITRQGLRLVELHVDRAYVNSPVVDDLYAAGGNVLAKPWGLRAHRPGLFTKGDFKISLRTHTITCPAGETEPFEPGDTVEFDPEACGACPLRAKCTQAASGHGRTVSIADDEDRQRDYRKLQQSPRGRAALRERTAVEHALAHIAARKGDTARYVGVRKNLFDLRRAAAIQNLEAIHRFARAA
ncbi:MAG: transposase [Acidimicrobiales bacterium]